jgi:hypothetical protein
MDISWTVATEDSCWRRGASLRVSCGGVVSKYQGGTAAPILHDTITAAVPILRVILTQYQLLGLPWISVGP